jgi:putative hemolysin
MEFLLIALLILLNGVFAMSELALAASRKSRLLAMAESGDRGAQKALDLMDQPNQFLSTIQVGITSIGVLNGIVGEAAFSGDLAAWLLGMPLGMSEGAAAITATALVVTLITFITIIFGELVPKRIGQLYPELVARWMARPMHGLAIAAKPFVKLLAATTQGVLTLLRIPTDVGRAMTEEEIRHSLEEGVDAGVIEQHEHQRVRNVFRLDDRPLTSLMVPRADVDWLDASLTRSRVPAARGCSRPGGRAFLVPCVPRFHGRGAGPGQRGPAAGARGRSERSDWRARPAGCLRAGDALGHGAAGAVPRALRPHGVRGG